MHMYAHFSGLFIYVIILVTTRKKICHAHIHALLSGLFYATCAHLRHYVVLTLLGGAEHTRVNWDLTSVTCLGIFCMQLMSFKLTTTRRVRNSALEVGLSYDSDLSRLPIGKG